MRQYSWRLAWACLLVGTAGPIALGQPVTTVGMSGRLEGLVLPGDKLEAKPLTDREGEVVVRVASVAPHGTAFRYDIEYFGLEPGTHDLRAYLRRTDGRPADDLPPIVVRVDPVLPPGQVRPNTLRIESPPLFGGYGTLVIVAAVVWVLVLLAVIASFVLPRKRAATIAVDKPVSLADRLRPLVEGAMAGTLARPELAELERSLLAYWRKRLRLEDADPTLALDTLRADPDAGPLLSHLEDWLHKPGPGETVDVGQLLAPYRDLPPEAIDLTGRAT